MVIAHNIPALNAYRNLNRNYTLASKALARLSSGYRINSAADDPAGLAVSEKMRGQIAGMRMGIQNARNSISLLQTAEGGLNEIHAMLQRLNELAVQAANGTYDGVDRASLDKEYQALLEEIGRISNSTNYNNIKLLDGTLGGRTGEQALSGLGLLEITATAGVEGELWLTLDPGQHTAVLRLNGVAHAIDLDGSGLLELDLGGGERVQVSYDPDNLAQGTVNGVSVRGGVVDAARAKGARADDQARFQVDAGSGPAHQIGVSIGDCSMLGLLGTGVAGQEAAQEALDAVKNAINMNSARRGEIGAQINRLEHTVRGLENSLENLIASESTIRDADMALEMMNYTKYTILTQAAQAMLAQAMKQPNAVLEMLKSL